MSNEKSFQQLNPISTPLIVSVENGTPYVLLRKKILLNDKHIDIIKSIISCAFHDYPLIIYPKFNDKLQSLASLCEKGILYCDKETGEYFFTI